MLTILRCPKCGAPALVDPSLSDAAVLKCAKCGFTDYLKAFKDDKGAQAKSATPALGQQFVQDIAKIAHNINALNMQGNIDGYVKQTCLTYNLSPWTLIEAINAYLRLIEDTAKGAGSASPAMGNYNPLRFVTLESGRARVDDLMAALRTELQQQQHRAQAASAPAPSATAGADAAEWIDRYNKLAADLQKKDKSYQTLLAAYRQAQATLQDNGLA